MIKLNKIQLDIIYKQAQIQFKNKNIDKNIILSDNNVIAIEKILNKKLNDIMSHYEIDELSDELIEIIAIHNIKFDSKSFDFMECGWEFNNGESYISGKLMKHYPITDEDFLINRADKFSFHNFGLDLKKMLSKRYQNSCDWKDWWNFNN